MVNWLYQSTLEISLVIALVLILRNPVRRLLGAHVSYWLWSLPLLRLLFSNRLAKSEVTTYWLKLPESNTLTAVYRSTTEISSMQIQLLLIIWLSGLVIWISLKVINNLKFKRLLQSKAVPIQPTELLAPDLQENITRKVTFFLSPMVSSPLITGLFRPRIYLPADFSLRYTQSQQKHILNHELTHAKRFDLWSQMLAEIIKALYWFNPLVHYAWHKFQADQELACDYQVLNQANLEARIEYGETLKQEMTAVLIPNSLTFFNHQHERFIMLAKHQKNTLLTLTGLLFFIAVAYLSLSHAEVTLTEKTDTSNGIIISYHFTDISLTSFVKLVADANQQNYDDITGMELLENKTVSIKADEVRSLDILKSLLKDHGLNFDRNKNIWEITKL